MYAMMNVEDMWDIEIDSTKSDSDYMVWLYSRLSDRIKNKFQNENPFAIVETECIEWKNSVLNTIISI